MKGFVIAVFLLACSVAFAQNTTTTLTPNGDKDVEIAPAVEANKPEGVFAVVEEIPSFPGGDVALLTFIKKNLVLPKVIQDGNVQGRVYVKFIVTKTGELTDIVVLKSLTGCKECDAEAIAVCKKMPKWKPGKQKGRAITAHYTQLISFRVDR